MKYSVRVVLTSGTFTKKYFVTVRVFFWPVTGSSTTTSYMSGFEGLSSSMWKQSSVWSRMRQNCCCCASPFMLVEASI